MDTAFRTGRARPCATPHHHLWQPERGYTWLDAPGLAGIRRPYTPADLRAEATAAGVNRTILVEGGRCHPDEVPEFLGHAADTDIIAGVVAWADIENPDLAATLAGYWRLRGGERLVGLHASPKARSAPPSGAGRSTLAECPNVACKLSGMVTEAGPQWTVDALRPFVAIAVRAFGAARLMFGSDWPVCLLAASYREVLAALRHALPRLPETDRHAISTRPRRPGTT